MTSKRLIIISGVTASGKTKASIEIARQMDAEIISADSVAVYKGLDIGSAKPSENERQTVKHHMINIRNIDERYDVYQFQQEARKIINTSNKDIVVVGGTGLYINALIKNYNFNEESDDIKVYDSLTNEELYNELKILDPATAKNIHINNRKRLLRSHSLVKFYKKPLNKIHGNDEESYYYPHAELYFLTSERDFIYDRINERVEKMFKKGLFEEVQTLYRSDSNLFSYQSINSIGYKEFKGYFLGNKNLEQVNEEIKRNTRRLAKRQTTWFKNKTNARIVDIRNDDVTRMILDK